MEADGGGLEDYCPFWGNVFTYSFVAFCQGLLGLNNFLPTHGFSIQPLKVKLLAGVQKATELQDSWQEVMSDPEPLICLEFR